MPKPAERKELAMELAIYGVVLEPVAVLLAKASQRPVKMVMTRDEVFRASGPTDPARERRIELFSIGIGCLRSLFENRFGDANELTLAATTRWLLPGYEDVYYYLWREGTLPVNVDPMEADLSDPGERRRLRLLLDHLKLLLQRHHLLLQSAHKESQPRLPIWCFRADGTLCLSKRKIIALFALLDDAFERAVGYVGIVGL